MEDFEAVGDGGLSCCGVGQDGKNADFLQAAVGRSLLTDFDLPGECLFSSEYFAIGIWSPEICTLTRLSFYFFPFSLRNLRKKLLNRSHL